MFKLYKGIFFYLQFDKHKRGHALIGEERGDRGEGGGGMRVRGERILPIQKVFICKEYSGGTTNTTIQEIGSDVVCQKHSWEPYHDSHTLKEARRMLFKFCMNNK